MRKYSWCIAGLTILSGTIAHAEPASLLSSIFQDHAVLQRDKPIAVWGQAAKGDEVTLSLGDAKVIAHTDSTGRWSTTLPATGAGGPYTLSAESSSGNQQTLKDVLVGDVFLCSGQSNMELSVQATGNAWFEIANAKNDSIRMLTVEKATSLTPVESLPKAEWQVESPATVGKWSAACFYFARELQKTSKAPIGLIHSSWGGSNIRPWISANGFHAMGGYEATLETLSLYSSNQAAAQQKFGAQWETWWRDKSKDTAGKEPWNDKTYHANEWRIAPAKLGDYQAWGIPDLEQFTGLLWYRTTIHLSAKQAKASAKLHLGGIDEVDQTWINGKVIGNSFGWGSERIYDIPANVLHAGDNTLVVNVTNTYSSGGLVGDFPRSVQFTNGESIPLTGEWQYLKVDPKVGYPARAPWEAIGGISGMYNAMIAPLGHYGLRGALWYQGESNTAESSTYQALLSGLFADWRSQFGNDLAFLVVQLPDYGARSSTPVESGWAEVREAERLAVAGDKHAGLAVTIDVGDPNNLHPTDKQSVGIRLARAARHVIYGESIFPSGPVSSSAHRDGNMISVGFTDIEQGLVAYSNSKPIGFELCGDAAGSCQFADARIDGTNVILSGTNVLTATHVRYCWADSPICTLYDKSGLPAGPFELHIQ